MARQRIPVYDYEVVKGDTLDILIRYSPDDTNPMDWATEDVVEVSVRLPDGTEIEVPADRIELVDPGTDLQDADPNILTYLLPAETDDLPVDVPCTYQVRLVEGQLKKTILTGVITGRFSAVDGEA